MTNWPQRFLDAGFTDREIAPGVRWTRKLGEVPSVEFIDSHKDLVRIQITEATFGRGFVGIIFPEEACPEVELLSFPSLPLARQAAEDLVCRLHGEHMKLDIEKLKELLEKATELPWTCEMVSNDDASWVVGTAVDAQDRPVAGVVEREQSELITPVDAVCESLTPDRFNGELIVSAVNSLPALIAEVERYQWRPIETAPKDGTDVLGMHVCISTQIVNNMFWIEPDEEGDPDDERGWWSYTHSEVSRTRLDGWQEPTHWMPLPPAPVSEGDA